METRRGNTIINVDEQVDKVKKDIIKLNTEVLDMLIKSDNDLIYGYFMIALTKTKNAIMSLPKED